MKQEDFNLRIAEDLAEIKSDMKHIKKNIPLCEKEKQNIRITNNTKLIYLILSSYIPLLLGIYFIIRGNQ
jgi:hypothetical protein